MIKNEINSIPADQFIDMLNALDDAFASIPALASFSADDADAYESLLNDLTAQIIHTTSNLPDFCPTCSIDTDAMTDDELACHTLFDAHYILRTCDDKSLIKSLTSPSSP